MWLWLVLSPLAEANERTFTYTYDALPLPENLREVEVSNTLAPGLDGNLSLRSRVEFEYPFAPRVLAAAYLNFSADSSGGGLDSVSYEVKGTLLSPIVAPVGLALYAETTFGPHEMEFEGKVILDKRVGDLIVAYNVVSELDLERQLSGTDWHTQPEALIENDLGVSYRNGRAFVGVEFHGPNVIVDGALEHGSANLGPSAGYASRNGWWFTASLMPRLTAYGPAAAEDPAWQVRTIVSMEL